MKDENFLEQYLGPSSRPPDDSTSHGSFIAVESYVAMLDLQLGNGNRMALPYSTLMKVTFDPSAGMTLHYPGEEVTLKGQRLESLYKAIAQQRVTSVRAVGSRIDIAVHGDNAIITEIVCQERRDQA